MQSWHLLFNKSFVSACARAGDHPPCAGRHCGVLGLPAPPSKQDTRPLQWFSPQSAWHPPDPAQKEVGVLLSAQERKFSLFLRKGVSLEDIFLPSGLFKFCLVFVVVAVLFLVLSRICPHLLPGLYPPDSIKRPEQHPQYPQLLARRHGSKAHHPPPSSPASSLPPTPSGQVATHNP